MKFKSHEAIAEEIRTEEATRYKEATLFRVRRRLVSLDNQVLEEGITSEDEANELLALRQSEPDRRIDNGCALVRVRPEFYIEPYQAMIPTFGFPMVGDSMYVPGGLEHATVLGYVPWLVNIKGGYASVKELKRKRDSRWDVFFELPFNIGLSRHTTYYSLEFLIPRQEGLEASYKDQRAYLVMDEEKKRAIETERRIASSNEGDWH